MINIDNLKIVLDATLKCDSNTCSACKERYGLTPNSHCPVVVYRDDGLEALKVLNQHNNDNDYDTFSQTVSEQEFINILTCPF